MSIERTAAAVYQTPPGKHPAYDGENPRRLIRFYGCVRCQLEHVEHQPDGLFSAHLLCQSKHGIQQRLPKEGEAFNRLVEEG